MFRRLLRQTMHALSAVALLILVLLAAEGTLQLVCPLAAPPATTLAPQGDLPALVFSPSAHHEPRRLTDVAISEQITVHLNSRGLRSAEPDEPKAESSVRIVVIGDETVWGTGVDDNHTISARLTQFLSRATGHEPFVVNAGVPGDCPLLSVIRLRQMLADVRPHLVIVHFDMSDVYDDGYYRRFLIGDARHQVCPHPHLLNSKPSPGGLAGIVFRSALVRTAARYAGMQPDAAPSVVDRYAWTLDRHQDLKIPIRHALQPLEQVQKLAEQHKFAVVVSTSPAPWQVMSAEAFPKLSRDVRGSTVWPGDRPVPQRILAAYCRQLQLAFCDTTDAFRGFSQPEKLFQNDSVLLSKYGHALYARELASQVLENNAIYGLFSEKARNAAPQHTRKQLHPVQAAANRRVIR